MSISTKGGIGSRASDEDSRTAVRVGKHNDPKSPSLYRPTSQHQLCPQFAYSTYVLVAVAYLDLARENKTHCC